ncbi:unnamed protein product [Closterium sp. NIES-54]
MCSVHPSPIRTSLLSTPHFYPHLASIHASLLSAPHFYPRLTSIRTSLLSTPHFYPHLTSIRTSLLTGPHLISFRPKAIQTALRANMTVTDEPGYYEEGKFGMRVENVLLVEPTELPHNFADRGWLKFKPITLVPIQTKLIENSLLSKPERDWLNHYHARCRKELSPFLQGADLDWLHRATEPIKAH